MTTAKGKKIALARGIGNYLDELARGEDRAFVAVGRGKATDDPAVVDDYADKLAAQIEELSSPLARLKLTQRVLDLRTAADVLRARVDGVTWRDHFVAHAAQWAEENGITYAAFRELGVPAKTLKEAGVSR